MRVILGALRAPSHSSPGMIQHHPSANAYECIVALHKMHSAYATHSIPETIHRLQTVDFSSLDWGCSQPLLVQIPPVKHAI